MIDIDKLFEEKWEEFIGSGENDNNITMLCKKFFVYGYEAATRCDPKVTVSTFEQWWDMYGKKRGKDKCLQKWMKMSKSDIEECLNATPAYVESTPDKQFRKDPLTYLNNKSWNDEIIIRTTNNGRQQITDEDRAEKLSDILTGEC